MDLPTLDMVNCTLNLHYNPIVNHVHSINRFTVSHLYHKSERWFCITSWLAPAKRVVFSFACLHFSEHEKLRHTQQAKAHKKIDSHRLPFLRHGTLIGQRWCAIIKDSLAYPGRRLSPTKASADFSQFVVTTANGTACETWGAGRYLPAPFSQKSSWS